MVMNIIICDHCGMFFSPLYFDYHIKTIHEGRGDYKCNHFGKFFSGLLKRHIKSIHNKSNNSEISVKKNCNVKEENFDELDQAEDQFKSEICFKFFETTIL